MPLCTGGELLERALRKRIWAEWQTAAVMRQLFSALSALHAHNILHLDIKPENILFETEDDDSPIKLTDFGLGRVLLANVEAVELAMNQTNFDQKLAKYQKSKDSGMIISKLGTVGFMAPELLLTGQGMHMFAIV
jgi:serine/threonine protein kinase